MDCPDIDRLIDFQAGIGQDPELEAHVDTCPDCRTDLRILRGISGAFRQEFEIPERLIQRVLADLPEAERSRPVSRALVPQAAITGLLGFVTALAAVIGVQPAGDLTLSGLLLFAAGIGTVSAVLQTAVEGKHPKAVT